MARFQDLEVTDVRNTIRDAVVVTLKPEKRRSLRFCPRAIFDLQAGL